MPAACQYTLHMGYTHDAPHSAPPEKRTKLLLSPRFCRYKTYDELYGYCYKVAGTVALMTTPVMGINPEYTVRPPTHQQDKQLGHSHENEK